LHASTTASSIPLTNHAAIRQAFEFATDLQPHIEAAREAGCTSLRQLADALNASGIPAAHGHGYCARVLNAELEQLGSIFALAAPPPAPQAGSIDPRPQQRLLSRRNFTRLSPSGCGPAPGCLSFDYDLRIVTHPSPPP
jgi:hypothetical protein